LYIQKTTFRLKAPAVFGKIVLQRSTGAFESGKIYRYPIRPSWHARVEGFSIYGWKPTFRR
jgi:hypothetical protein